MYFQALANVNVAASGETIYEYCNEINLLTPKRSEEWACIQFSGDAQMRNQLDVSYGVFAHNCNRERQMRHSVPRKAI